MLFEVDWADVGNRRPLHRLEPDGTGNRSNDDRVDPAGRFVLGTMYEDAAAGRTTGSLYRVDEQVTACAPESGSPTASPSIPNEDSSTGPTPSPPGSSSPTTTQPTAPGTTNAPSSTTPTLPVAPTEPVSTPRAVTGRPRSQVGASPASTPMAPLPTGSTCRSRSSMPAFGGDDRTTLFVTTIGDEHGRPATPGRDGVRPGSLLAIEGTGATGIAETPFGFSKQATSRDSPSPTCRLQAQCKRAGPHGPARSKISMIRRDYSPAATRIRTSARALS